MHRILIALAALLLAAGCVSPMPGSGNEAPVEIRGSAQQGNPSFKRGGCDDLVPIYAETTQEGIAKENAWIDRNYPGARRTGQTLATCGESMVDVITVRTQEGVEHRIWFDITSFFGKTGEDDLDSMLDG